MIAEIDREEWREQEQADRGPEDIHEPLGDPVASPEPRRLMAADRRGRPVATRSRGPLGDPVDPDVGLRQLVDLRPDPPGRSARERDDEVGRADAVDPLGEPVNLAEHRDGVGLRVDRQLAASADAPSVTVVPRVDEPDDRQSGPGAFPEAPGNPPTGARVAHDQKPTTVDAGLDGAGRRGAILHGCSPIHRCRGQPVPRVGTRAAPAVMTSGSTIPGEPLQDFPQALPSVEPTDDFSLSLETGP